LSELRRAGLCLHSILLACSAVYFSGLWEPAAEKFHRWSLRLTTTFLLIYTPAMLLTLRTRIVTSAWLIPLCTVLGWFGASFAYIIYFAGFETDRFETIFRSDIFTDIFAFAGIVFLIMPLVSMAWLVAAIAAGLFLLMDRILRPAREAPLPLTK
jgi:hypothetical protein